jgi:hypothetical protein
MILVPRGLLLAVLVLACTAASPRAAERVAPSVRATPVPGATETWSEKRLYRASYASSPSPVPLLALHAWTLTVTDAEARPVDDASITVLGGMPAHAHGLPTTPAVRGLGGGRYLVEGLKFHMPGAWVVAFRINARAGIDTANFAFDLP